VKKTIPQLLAFGLLLLVTSNAVPAQSAGSLSNLPEADTLIYINPQRILNEAAPRLLPEKDLAGMRKAFGDVKQFVGIDPSKVDYIVVAVRFRKPTADLSFMPPEVIAVASGDFSADSLVVLARMASGGKLRDEKYGAKTLGLMTIEPVAREAQKNPLLKSFSEVAIAPLNANTIAVGTTAYLKAAIDAGEGNGRISVESLNSLLRDPSVLISVAGSPWNSFGKSFGLLGSESNPKPPRCESNLGNFYAAVTMDATNFMLRGALGADNPDTATIINNLLSGMLRHATSSVPDKTAQTALKTLSLNARENEVVLSADIPQQMVIDFMKERMKPKQDSGRAGKTKPPTRKPAVRRRTRRSSR
jgi:hypothetical protein